MSGARGFRPPDQKPRRRHRRRRGHVGAMGKGQSKPMAPTTPTTLSWDQNVTIALRDLFGITARDSAYLTGVDAITLPMAFAAGAVIGAGVGLYRGVPDIGSTARGMGTVLLGLTLAVPPYVRLVYAPWLFISPTGCAWAAFTSGIVGVGIHTMQGGDHQPLQHYRGIVANPAVVRAANDADRQRAADEFFGKYPEKFFGAALIGAGVYLAAPGALRVLFMYGGAA